MPRAGFRPATGCTPLAYVPPLRPEEAKQMPETADLPIDLVAEKVGYREPAALRRIFKCATGISPLQRTRARGFESIAAILALAR
ncbi:helix-turn-helix domain-containing protein [Albidovulum sp.]|uniref:helix-turn-helix domain-containing protein n=1 Tax=Albidovulum sp. TaxID=1872424 RepID=UPI0025C41FDE|nr:helix-turn-helix domain-containing protein [Defluviimonas sp.]